MPLLIVFFFFSRGNTIKWKITSQFWPLTKTYRHSKNNYFGEILSVITLFSLISKRQNNWGVKKKDNWCLRNYQTSSVCQINLLIFVSLCLSFLFSGQKWTQSGHIFASPLRLTPWFWKGYFQKQSTSLLSGRSTNTELAHPVLSTTPCARSVRPNVDIWARVLCRGGQAPSLLFLKPHFETSSFSV